jgi:glycerol kinase
MAYSTRDVVEAMEADSGVRMRALRVDGGATANDWFMQFQADVLGIPVRRPAMVEMTAFGAAGLAGLATGVWGTPEDFVQARPRDAAFQPEADAADRAEWTAGWRRALGAARAWAHNGDET